MMKTALVLCFADPAVMGGRIDPLASNHRAHVFYQSLGFKPVGRRIFTDESDCLVHHLSRRHWHALFASE
jgi:aminoglycoside 6'-N-acetyltransferase